VKLWARVRCLVFLTHSVVDCGSLIRRTGYSIHVGQLFVVCALHAGGIVLLSAACYGLQNLVNACTYRGTKWDIKFNPPKSQLTAFSGHNPSRCAISLNGNPIPWVTKVKYLGPQFCVTVVLLMCQICVGNFKVSSITVCLLLANGLLRCQQCNWSNHIVHIPCCVAVRLGP